MVDHSIVSPGNGCILHFCLNACMKKNFLELTVILLVILHLYEDNSIGLLQFNE